MNTLKRILITLMILIGTCVLLGGAFITKSVFRNKEAFGTLEDYQMRYIQTVIDTSADGSVVLRPDATLPDLHTGVIFYPDENVEPAAYIPLLSGLCEQGYSCFIPKMPWNTASLKDFAAKEVMESETDIENWFIGGHSQGGRCAARYVSSHPETFKGIFMLAAYTDKNLKDIDIPMLSVYGDRDTVMDVSAYQRSMTLNPAKTDTYSIKGGNHTQFGDYEADRKDSDALLTPDEQRAETLQLLIGWFEKC